MSRAAQIRFRPEIDVLEDRSVPSVSPLPGHAHVSSEHLTRGASRDRYLVKWSSVFGGTHTESWNNFTNAKSSACAAIIMNYKQVRIIDTATGKQVPFECNGKVYGGSSAGNSTTTPKSTPGTASPGTSRSPSPAQTTTLIQVTRQDKWLGTREVLYFGWRGTDYYASRANFLYEVVDERLVTVPSNRVWISYGGAASVY